MASDCCSQDPWEALSIASGSTQVSCLISLLPVCVCVCMCVCARMHAQNYGNTGNLISPSNFLSFFFFFFFVFLGPYLQHVWVPRLGVKSEL